MTVVGMEPPERTDAVATTARTRRGMPSRRVLLGVAVLAIYVLAAVLAPWITSHDPNRQDILNPLADPTASHWLGTDVHGRDVFARLLYAARVDLLLGVLLALLPGLLGCLIGAVAGYSGRFVDSLLMRIAELFQTVPAYIFILALVAVLEPGPRSLLIAFTLLAWVVYARIMRAEILRVRGQDYIQAARAGGLPGRRILFRHAVPNAINPVVVYFPADVLQAIVALAGLSFLGVGIQSPTAEWGAMIAEGRSAVRDQWWLVAAPGLCIVGLGIGLMLLADGLDDRLRRRR